MARSPPFLMCGLILAGCTGSDREPYSRRHYWRDAEIQCDKLPESRHVDVSVVPGAGTVLEVTNGRYRSKRTTAHSSHESFYFAIPIGFEAGDVFHPSLANGTFAYDAFAGYWSQYVDPDASMQAEVEILNVSDDGIKAHVTVQLTSVRESRQVSEAQRRRSPVTLDEICTFHPQDEYHYSFLFQLRQLGKLPE